MSLDLSSYWYRPSLHPVTAALLPLSWLFQGGAVLRRKLYQVGILKTQYVNVPVIVVGNITVGGTGKTPFVIWLVQYLKTLGYQPGIVSRGVGGENHDVAQIVTTQTQVKEAGDEAVLLAKNTGCPVVVCINRPAAVQKLIAHFPCDIVISDDGLQHYRLGRNLEIAMVDGLRGFGNQQLLPAGPLRESTTRLEQVDFIITNRSSQQAESRFKTNLPTEFFMSLMPSQFISVKNEYQVLALSALQGKTVHAIAAIGHPQQFFSTLKNMGLTIIPHVFPDHHLFAAHELSFGDDYPLVMTEKDAVKCKTFADDRYWYLQIQTKMSENFEAALFKKLPTG